MSSRSRPIWGKTASLTTTPSVIALPDAWKELKISVDAVCYGQVGAAYTAPAVSSTNGVLTISTPGTPTSGVFQLRCFPASTLETDTADIARNASSATIKTRLTDTGLFASGDITAAGGSLPTDVTLTFTGVYAGIVPRIIVVDSTFDLGTAIARVTTVPDGNGGYAYLAADVQEVWASDSQGMDDDRFLYLATVSGTGTAFISAYD